MSGEKIRPPTEADGYTREEVENHAADMLALESDPRTSGRSHRPSWLVARVLADAARTRRVAETHEFDTGRCCSSCNAYHYRCASCSSDCTAGAPAGPAFTDARGVTRCAACSSRWQRRIGALTPETEHEARAVVLGLEAVGRGGELAAVAHEILARLELAR